MTHVHKHKLLLSPCLSLLALLDLSTAFDEISNKEFFSEVLGLQKSQLLHFNCSRLID